MKTVAIFAAVIAVGFMWQMDAGENQVIAQNPSVSSSSGSRGSANPVTIPISIKVTGGGPETELQQIGPLTVSEDGEPQTVLSIRAVGTNSPLTIAVLIQDDLVSSISNEIKSLREFIRLSPRGSRVLVGYVRSGSLQVRQRRGMAPRCAS